MNYFIWSIEHNRWWAPNRNGYTRHLHKAGIYKEKEAQEILVSANRGGVNEVLIPGISLGRVDGETLYYWVIYTGVRELPNCYIAQKWELNESGMSPTTHVMAHPDIAKLRMYLPPGLVRIGREEVDDPCIVETWI